ncbi:hypothetical protein DTO280E4_2320 [Paecilomyces variotii]|nr:hypothetical protein DTO207G8_3578 [Paecilomyces variotii]KAJ9363730.1 hypothetical protein DTO280E4_2320 [Paecilomyces variotii]KAJ9386424.1 hypothetical protein DTO063F5_3687 [Paecilomyces variotii]
MHARSRSEPPGPSAPNPFSDGAGYGSQQAPMQLDQRNMTINLPHSDANNNTPLQSSQTPGVPQQGFRRHRRASGFLNREELDNFLATFSYAKYPGPDRSGLEAATRPTPPPHLRQPLDTNSELHPVFGELNRAFNRARMSLSNGSGLPNSSPGGGMFTNYIDNNPNLAGIPRQTPSPSPPHASAQVNGGGMAGINGGMPMNAGHQMDLNHLYEMVLELSEVLKNNREMTKGIINSAEEIMRRASSEGASPNLQQVNGEISAARIAELERALVKEKRLVEVLKREQVENTRLIGEYETAVGTMVEQIRNYCHNNTMHFLAQKRHYNNLLQAERDAHLESRLDRDHWHAMTMKCAEMIRTAYRLRCEEEELPIRIVAGLQNEVRAYRNALGMEPEKPEEEYGWEILKDAPPGVD